MASANTSPPPCFGSELSPFEYQTSTMEREYEFFVTTEEPHQPEGPERGLIRRLVMRNFFETKWSSPTDNTSANNSASTVQAKTRLKSRFRLPKPGREASEIKAKGKSKDSEGHSNRDGLERREKRPRVWRKVSAQPTLLEQSEKESRKASPAEEEGGQGGGSRPRLLLKINPNAHRFDPFDVLPVPGTPELDVLFKMYKCGSRANSIAINAHNTWWKFMSNDAGLLHATMATWSLYGVLARGMDRWEVQKLRHKNEAIKEVNTKIGSHNGTISDELVGTVATLASFENLLGAYDAAQLHIAALKRMVNARGGLFAFGHNDGLIRGIMWVDFHTAAAFHTPPSFPQIQLDPDAPPLPDPLLEEAAYTSPTSLLQLSTSAIDCFNIFYRLHRLALAISSHWFSRVSRLTISNILCETEYIILSVPDFSRDFLDFDLETKEDVDEDLDERAQTADGACVVEAMLAASQMFIYASLREIPTKAKIFSILLDRLRVAINRPNISMMEVWTKEKNLNILLWVLVVACSVAQTWGGRSWWIGKLAEVVKELGLRGELDLEQSMQRVAWTDVFFGDVLNSVWEEVRAYLATVQRTESYLMRTREQGKDPEDTIDPHLLEDLPYCSVQHNMGRWRVGGWYI